MYYVYINLIGYIPTTISYSIVNLLIIIKSIKKLDSTRYYL